MGQLAPDLEERRELDRRSLADGALEQCALDRRIEAVAELEDIAGERPGSRAREGALFGLRVEPVQEVRLVCDEEQNLGREAVRRAPVAPVLRVDTDIEVDEARGQRGRSDDRILSLNARGMTVREIRGHLEEHCGVAVSSDLMSRVTAQQGGLPRPGD